MQPDAIFEAELIEPPGRGPAPGCFGVPRRFGIGTLLVVTAAYGALLALLQVAGCNRAAIAWLVIFVSLIGTAQMLLFGARRPREASVLAGAIGLPLLAILAPVFHGEAVFRGELLCLLMSAVLFGVPAGYLAGGVVAGVFLIMDGVQRLLSQFSEADDQANGNEQDRGPGGVVEGTGVQDCDS